MITRKVTLGTGLKIGTAVSKEATIREETLGDELDVLEAGLKGTLAHRRIMMRRVSAIGQLENPAPEVIAKLTRTDWELIEEALNALDLELAKEAGLVKGAEADKAGRDEPGGAAPGDV